MNTEKQTATEELRKLLPEGSAVYTLLESVSASGMTRRIRFLTIQDNKPVSLTYLIGKALGYKINSEGSHSLTIRGCGMDMGFHVVNGLSYVLHGYPEAGNENRRGYTLRHEWL